MSGPDGKKKQRIEKPPWQKSPKDQSPRNKPTREKESREKESREKEPREKEPKEREPKEREPKEREPREKKPGEKAPEQKVPRQKPSAARTAEEETPTVDVLPVDIENPDVGTEAEWKARDAFSALLDPGDYRTAAAFVRFVLTPQLENAVIGEAGGRSYRVADCVGYFHYQADQPTAAFDNAMAAACIAARSTAILVDPEKNRILCSVAPELAFPEVVLGDDPSTRYGGATALQNANGRLIGDRRIEAVVTADGFVLLPYEEERDVTSGRIAFRSVGIEVLPLTLARVEALSSVTGQAPAPPAPLDVHLQFQLDLGTEQSLPFPDETRVDMLGSASGAPPRVIASCRTAANGRARFRFEDRRALGDALGVVYFAVTFGDSQPPDIPRGFSWDSRAVMAAGGVVPGLWRNPTGSTYGTEQDPIRFLLRVPAAKHRKSLPLQMSAVTAVNLTPFGKRSAAGVGVTNEWTFEYGKQPANTSEVLALFGGQLRCVAEGAGGVGLQLTAAAEAIAVPEDRLDWPAWFPAAGVATYASLDPVAIRERARSLIESSPEARQAAIKVNPALADASAQDLTERFLLGEFAIDVTAGAAIARGAVIAPGRHRLTVSAKAAKEDGFNVNLAYSVAQWVSSGELATTGTPEELAESLTNTGGPAIASGRVHAPTNGAQLLALLEGGAADGDLVLLVKGGDYALPKAARIVKPLVVVAEGDSGAPGATVRGMKPPLDQRNTPEWAQLAHGAFVIEGLERGLVQLRGIGFRDSAARQGGAIEVIGCDRVLIEDCRFTGNEAYAGGWTHQGFGGAICARHSSIWVRRCSFHGNASNCRGGAIGVFGYAWPIISDCHFEANAARKLGVWNPKKEPFRQRGDGGAVGVQTATPADEGVFDRVLELKETYGETELVALYLAGALPEEDQKLLEGLKDGKIGQFWKREQVEGARRRRLVVKNCTFLRNSAVDDGGGMYATGLARVLCVGLLFEGNRAQISGGAIRISTASDFILAASDVRDNESNTDLEGVIYDQSKHRWRWTGDGGGGIACRTSHLSLFDVRIEGNKANRFAGGGVFFTSTDDGAIPGAPPLVKTDWNLIRDFLILDFESPDGSPVAEYRAFKLHVSGCSIRRNYCGWCGEESAAKPGPGPGPRPIPDLWLKDDDSQHAKGGGIYALRYRDDEKGVDFPPLEVRIEAGTVLADNTAAFNSGARHVYVADLTAPKPNNPVRDTRHCSITSTGVLTAPFRYP